MGDRLVQWTDQGTQIADQRNLGPSAKTIPVLIGGLWLNEPVRPPPGGGEGSVVRLLLLPFRSDHRYRLVKRRSRSSRWPMPLVEEHLGTHRGLRYVPDGSKRRVHQRGSLGGHLLTLCLPFELWAHGARETLLGEGPDPAIGRSRCSWIVSVIPRSSQPPSRADLSSRLMLLHQLYLLLGRAVP